MVPWYFENNASGEDRKLITRSGEDLCFPALWLRQTMVAYSSQGYTQKIWSLPADWVGVKSLKITEITPSELKPLSRVEVQKNQDSPQQAIMIEPADGGQL